MARLRGDPGKRCVESIGEKTRLLALIERPVEHGPSPRMRGASFVAVQLTAEDLREIDSAAARIRVQGTRYSESAQRMIDR